jgi:phage tail-like protein
MTEAKFVVINIPDRWLMGTEITDGTVIELGKDSPVNLEISDKGLSLKPSSKQAIYMTAPIDSEIEGCVGHRLVIDADYPEHTRVKVAFSVSNKKITEAKDILDSSEWSEEIVNPEDTLLTGREEQDKRGRYLWLKITMEAEDAILMPVIRSIKLYFPRETYLRYLPAIYQEDASSRDFLERYLSVFETILSKLENGIKDTPHLFDPYATPSEFLPWLSTWVGSFKDENWPEDKWREFLSRAVSLYKQRGTPAGIRELIKLYSGKYPIIVERSLLKCGTTEYDEVLNRIFGCAYSFCVLVNPDQVKTEKDRKVLRRIVASEKPAHTVGGIVVLEPWVRLDWHTYLGKNTFLNQPLDMHAGSAVLSISTILAEEQTTEIEKRIRKGQELCRVCFESCVQS